MSVYSHDFSILYLNIRTETKKSLPLLVSAKNVSSMGQDPDSPGSLLKNCGNDSEGIYYRTFFIDQEITSCLNRKVLGGFVH